MEGNKMTVKIYHRRGVGLFLLLCALFFISRVAFLDSDLPPWDVCQYQPIDELYYSITAFNIYHYGDILHKVIPYVESDSSTENLLGNLLASITLFLFGNNYYGMRMSSVLAAFFIFVMMYFTLKNYLFDASSCSESGPGR